jgi:hypothetical protein
MKIGLDVDGVLANFPRGVIERARLMGLSHHFPKCCHDISHWNMSDKLGEVMKDAWTDPSFWLGLKPLAYSLPLDFSPECYITSRPIADSVTEEWLNLWRFPAAPVVTVKQASEKLQHIQERELDLFVDDYYETVIQLLDAGVNAVLYKAPYQRGHLTKHLPKISHLRKLNEYVEQKLSADSR